MSNPFELDFEFQLEQFVLRTPKPPLAKLKWEKQKTLWKVASEQSPISRPKVLTISRHHFGSPKKPPEPLLPMLPDKTKHVSHRQQHRDIGEDDSHDIDDSDLKENESHRLPPAHPTQHPTKPPPAGAEKPTILVPLNDTHPHHNRMTSNLASSAFSASYSTYASSLHANYIPLHHRKIHVEVFDRLSQPKKIRPSESPHEIDHKKVSKELFERLHNESKARERARMEEYRKGVNMWGDDAAPSNRYKGSTAPKGFFDRLAVPKPHDLAAQELKKSEGERRKKKAHVIAPKDLERLATPRYRVLWAKRAKPEKLHDVEEDEGEKDGDEEDGERDALEQHDDAEPQTETTAQPSSSSDSQAKKSAPPSAQPRPLSRNASPAEGRSSESLSVSSGSRPISRKEPLPAIPASSGGGLKREEGAISGEGAEASAQEVEDTNTKAELVDGEHLDVQAPAHQSSEVADTYDGPEETHEETSSAVDQVESGAEEATAESSDQAPPTEPEASVEVVEETHPNVVDATHHDEGKPEEEASPVEYGEDFGEEQQHDVPALEHVEDAAIVENVEMPSGGDEASAVHEPEVNASKFATEGADENQADDAVEIREAAVTDSAEETPAAFDTANNSQESSVEDAVISSEEVPASAVDANVVEESPAAIDVAAEYESPVVDDASPSSEHSPVETTSEELVQEIENAAVIHTEESGETVVAEEKPVEDAPEENITDSPTSDLQHYSDAADAFEESGEVPGGVDGGAAKAKEEGEVDAIAQA